MVNFGTIKFPLIPYYSTEFTFWLKEYGWTKRVCPERKRLSDYWNTFGDWSIDMLHRPTGAAHTRR
jgi:hypothetical protein